MKAEVVISPSGEVTIVTREGTFDGGKEKVEQLLARLKASGVKIQGEPKFEQHRHDEEELKHRHHHHLGVKA